MAPWELLQKHRELPGALRDFKGVNVTTVTIISPPCHGPLLTCGFDSKFFPWASQIPNETPHKHWGAIVLSILSYVFALQHTGKMWIFSPFLGAMKQKMSGASGASGALPL